MKWRTVPNPNLWQVLVGLFGALGLLAVLGGLQSGEVATLIAISPWTMGGGWFLGRASKPCVSFNESAVRYRGYVKTHTLPWTEVRAVRVAAHQDRPAVHTMLPFVVMADGREIPMARVAGYAWPGRGNRRVTRIVGALEDARMVIQAAPRTG